MNEFKRENRYMVIKIDDVAQYLTTDEVDQLNGMLNKIAALRMDAGRRLDKFVCVADDWPEYEKVWSMIRERVEGEAR